MRRLTLSGKLNYRFKCKRPVAKVAGVAVARECGMKYLLQEHIQIIVVCIISSLILYWPQLWYAYFMDFVVCSWALNMIIDFLKKILNKGDVRDEIRS